MSWPLLRVEALTVERAGVPIVVDIDFAVDANECVALIGANGAGKSTLLGALIGLLPARSGGIVWRGHAIGAWPAYRRARSGIGYCPEGRRPFAGLTVIDNLQCACRAPARRRRSLLDAQFDLFPELGQRQNALAWQLSGGEAQMLALARALMGQPQILLLDEPFLGLAPDARQRLAQALISLAANGLAMLIAEGEADRLLALKPRWLMLERGRLAPVDNLP